MFLDYRKYYSKYYSNYNIIIYLENYDKNKKQKIVKH